MKRKFFLIFLGWSTIQINWAFSPMKGTADNTVEPTVAASYQHQETIHDEDGKVIGHLKGRIVLAQ